MKRMMLVLAGTAVVTGCAAIAPKEPEKPANAGYCSSLSLLLDSVDPRMAVQARADMQTAGCATGG